MHSPPVFKLPGWPSLPTQPPSAIGVSGVSAGVFVSPTKGWCTVTYRDIVTGLPVAFQSSPSVVALAEVREGAMLPVDAPKIVVPDFPKIEIPYRAIPPLPLTCYRCTYPEGMWILSSECGWMQIAIKAEAIPEWFEDAVPDTLKKPSSCPKGHGSVYIEETDDFGLGLQGLSIYWTRNLIDWRFSVFDLNWIRDALLKVLYWAYYGVGKAMGSIVEQFGVESQMAQAVMNRADLDVVEAVEEKSKEALDEFNSTLETSVNEGLSKVIPTLYEMMGLMPGMMLNPLSTREVGTENFEVYSPSESLRIHYVAIGVSVE